MEICLRCNVALCGVCQGHMMPVQTCKTFDIPAQGLVASGQLSPQARFLVTGHSLGGALAVLAGFDIKLAIGSLQMEMYTYGTPYPGNRAFAREFNELIPETWHVIHDGVSHTCSGLPFSLALTRKGIRQGRTLRACSTLI